MFFTNYIIITNLTEAFSIQIPLYKELLMTITFLYFSVPTLNLDSICGKDIDDYRPIELDPYHYNLGTPNTSTTCRFAMP